MARRGAISVAAAALVALAGCETDGRPPEPGAPPADAANGADSATASRNEAAPDAPPAASGPLLSASGFDTIRIGAPPAAASGYDLVDDGSYDDVCRLYTSPRLPRVYAIVEEGLVMRLTAYAEPGAQPPAMRTDRGIGVGSTEAEVRAAYSPLREQPHHYSQAPAKDLFFDGEGASPGLRFEISEDGRVRALHAGLPPVLEYAEACS